MNHPCPHCGVLLALATPGDTTCGACGRAFTVLAEPGGSHICRRCGTVGKPQAGDWSGVVGFLIQCALIVATLIAVFTFWPLGLLLLVATIAFGLKRLRNQHALCPGCGARDLIPLGTPAGQQLAHSFRV
jgi:hypothetical protein